MDKLIALLENYVEADEINANSTFGKDLGLSSFDTVCLIADIKKEFGPELSIKDFVKYKTVGEMAAYLQA